MAMPALNTTCDIYRAAVSPPDPPAVAGVACCLYPYTAESPTLANVTHRLYLPPTADLRDGYTQGSLGVGAAADKVYVPDKNGTLFNVVIVRRSGRGTSADHKEALLIRASGSAVSWPTDEV